MKPRGKPYIWFCIFTLLIFTGLCPAYENIYHSPIAKSNPAKRIYYIAAEEIEWDYAPSGMNNVMGTPFGEIENVFLRNDSNRIGSKNIKAVYREYTDASFTVQKMLKPDMGILGPVIRAEVGDSVIVVFKNNASFPFSIHAHGLAYDADNEGMAGVEPGLTFTYHWKATENSGPGPKDASSVGWLYHSHVMEHDNKDINSGLIGSLVVYKKGYLKNGKAMDVDEEKFSLFMIMDENNSLYLDKNKEKYTSNNESNEDPEFIESNLKHSINGLLYGNCKFTGILTGDKVRWYIMDLGNELDNHTAHWHGNTVTFLGSHTDVIFLGPANLVVADMKADNPGTWQYHCHVNDHLSSGMISIYEVGNQRNASGPVQHKMIMK